MSELTWSEAMRISRLSPRFQGVVGFARKKAWKGEKQRKGRGETSWIDDDRPTLATHLLCSALRTMQSCFTSEGQVML